MTAVLSPRDQLATEIRRRWPRDRRPLGEVFADHDAILHAADVYAVSAPQQPPEPVDAELAQVLAEAELVRAECAARYGDTPPVTGSRKAVVRKALAGWWLCEATNERTKR